MESGSQKASLRFNSKELENPDVKQVETARHTITVDDFHSDID